jgi:hypothetical protein
MPLVHPCSRPGCSILTMGAYCVDHEGAAPHESARHPLAVAALAAAVAALLAAFLARARVPL